MTSIDLQNSTVILSLFNIKDSRVKKKNLISVQWPSELRLRPGRFLLHVMTMQTDWWIHTGWPLLWALPGCSQNKKNVSDTIKRVTVLWGRGIRERQAQESVLITAQHRARTTDPRRYTGREMQHRKIKEQKRFCFVGFLHVIQIWRKSNFRAVDALKKVRTGPLKLMYLAFLIEWYLKYYHFDDP